MHFSTTTIAAVLLIISEAATASLITPHHVHLGRRSNRQKRCNARLHNNDSSTNNDFNIQNNHSSSSSTPAPTTTQANNNPAPTQNNNNNNNQPQYNTGVIQVAPNNCGNSGATPDTSSYTGPNGSIDFINCGIEGGGWFPPDITLDNVISKSLSDVINWNGSPFAPCAPYVGIFESIGSQTGIPAILLASIAMQESTCQPWVTGKNGEIGMMQITPDKCGGVSDCYDPWTNVNIGATYFRGVYDSVHNLPAALGQYNGWYLGMTEWDANNKCCSCRNNLDYLHNVLNGFMQGIDPASRNMGKYFNLQSC